MKKFFSLLILFSLAIATSAAQDAVKPVIGITSTAGGGTSTSIALTYVKSVMKAGGVPVVLPVTADPELLSRMLDCVDAVVFTGGEDIDPLKWYGEEPLRQQGGIAPERDSFDMALMKMAVERGVPILGICRGMQAMNVAFGGTLYQDIPSQLSSVNPLKHYQEAPRDYGTHTVEIAEGSLFHRQVGVRKLRVNSFHHQSVKDVAPGFRVTARSPDGVVEAIEKTGTDKVFGVQFHPEGFVSSGDDTFLGIFEYLVEIAKREMNER